MGYEPAAGGGHPVYLFTSGGYPSFPGGGLHSDMPEMLMMKEMAKRGFVSAIAEIPQIDTYGMKCDTIPGNLSLTNFSQMVYQWRGKGDYTSQSPLALLCRRNLTDCEAGISIHGHSLGGLLANLAPQHAIGVRSLLIWGSGSRLPYGDHYCCGLFSGGRECCDPHALVGGAPLPCETYAATASYLDRTRRRIIVYANDQEYGDCYFTYDGNSRPPRQPRCNVTSATNPAGALILGRRDSGYDCGENPHCIQADGSGYYVPDITEAGVWANRHNFHNMPTEHTAKNHDNSYYLNVNWVNARTAWGMQPCLDWLDRTARRPN